MTIKKPKLWSIAILTGVLTIVLCFLLHDPEHASSAVVAIVLLVYFTLVLACLIYAFFRQLKYNVYSYNVIYYSGFAVLVFILLISHVILTLQVLESETSYSISMLFNNMSDTIIDYIRISVVFVVAFSILLILSNIFLIIKKGARLVYFACIFVAIALVVIEWFLFREDDVGELSVPGVIAVILATALYLYFECMVTGAIIAVIIAAKKRPAKDRDFILILGCGLNEDGTPAPILAGRIDEALKFYHEQLSETKKNPVLIPTGGKGTETRNSESEAMNRYLLERGVPEDHIIKEDRSKTTWENMVFSKEIIDSRNPEAKISFVTSSYHVFRSGIMAGHAGLKKTIGLGAKTKWYFWPNAVLREFISLLTSHVFKQVMIILVILFIIIAPVIANTLV